MIEMRASGDKLIKGTQAGDGLGRYCDASQQSDRENYDDGSGSARDDVQVCADRCVCGLNSMLLKSPVRQSCEVL